MAAQTLSIPDAEHTATNLTAQAHSYTVAALDRTKSIPYRRLARRRAQLLTYAAGALLRFGKNLQVDYGGARIRPALSGTDYFNASRLDGKLGYSIYAGFQGRAVAQNIFLDGSAFHQDPSVDKKPLVADFQAGVSVFWSDDLQLNFSAVRRTREFQGQNSPDNIGTASISFSL